MKKVLSLFLAIVMMVGVFSSIGIVADAQIQTAAFGTQYVYTYGNSKDCIGTITLTEDGVVPVSVVRPTDKYGECTVKLFINDGEKNIVQDFLHKDTYYLFLQKGTYTYNFNTPHDTPQTPIKYSFNFIKSYIADSINPIKWGVKYNHYYNTGNCYGSFKLTQAGTVTFDLTQPLNGKKSACSSTLYIYDMNQNGKEIVNEWYSSSENYSLKKSIRLPKGSYEFNYYCGSGKASNKYFEESDHLRTSSYKVSFTKANAPKTPKLAQTVTKKKWSYYTEYSISANFADNEAYDGVELWLKKDNEKWKLHQSAENSTYYRNTKVSLSVYSSSNYVVFYKVRAYSLYDSQKVYSNFSNTLYTKTSLKPKSPSITVKSSKKKTATISWNKISGTDGYVIYSSTKKKSGYKKVTTIKKSSTKSYTNKNLKSKKTYYYKVRSFKKVNNETIYSNYSSVKKVKIK